MSTYDVTDFYCVVWCLLVCESNRREEAADKARINRRCVTAKDLGAQHHKRNPNPIQLLTDTLF